MIKTLTIKVDIPNVKFIYIYLIHIQILDFEFQYYIYVLFKKAICSNFVGVLNCSICTIYFIFFNELKLNN